MSERKFDNIIRIVFLLLSGLAIAPFLLLCFYNHPVGIHEWDWVSNLGGQFDNQSFLAYQLDSYYINGGRYASAALMSFTPYWYCIFNFQLLFCLNILLFAFSLAYFFKKVYEIRYFEPSNIYLFLGFLLLYFSNVSGVFDSIYRFTGILTYQIGFILLLFLLGILIPALIKGNISKSLLFVACLIGFLLPGLNEISMIAVAYLGVILSFFYWKKHGKLPKWLYAIAIFVLVGIILAIVAPGNYHRLGEYNNANFGLGKCVALTIACSGFSLVSWFSSSTFLLITVVSFPLFLKLAKKNEVQKVFNQPLVAIIASLLFVPLAYFPLLYGTKGMSFAERVIDLTFIHFCSGWLYFIQSCAVILVQKYPNTNDFLQKKEVKLAFAFLGLCLFGNIFFGKLDIDRSEGVTKNSDRILMTSNVGNAWKIILDGSAKQYDKEVMHEYDAVYNCKSDTCEVKMPSFFPPQLYEKISDRRHRPQGDHFMGKSLKTNVKSVRYFKE